MKPAIVRKRLGLSQGQYAKLIGATQSAVSKWERGAAPVSGVLHRLNYLLFHNPAAALLLLKAFKSEMPGELPANLSHKAR